jgi:hypothetical protein
MLISEAIHVAVAAKIGAMKKTQSRKDLGLRIDEYMARKALDRQTAIDTLLEFALDVIDGRRKGGTKVGNRPEQEKHLKRARKARR